MYNLDFVVPSVFAVSLLFLFSLRFLGIRSVDFISPYTVSFCNRV